MNALIHACNRSVPYIGARRADSTPGLEPPRAAVPMVPTISPYWRALGERLYARNVSKAHADKLARRDLRAELARRVAWAAMLGAPKAPRRVLVTPPPRDVFAVYPAPMGAPLYRLPLVCSDCVDGLAAAECARLDRAAEALLPTW